MAKDPSDRLAELKSRASQMDQQSHYAFFDLPNTASNNDILTAYRNFAKTFHVDTFSRLDLSPDDRHTIDAFFARLNDARSTLLDSTKRQHYDDSLSNPQPPPDDLNHDDLSALFEADSAFRKGSALLASGAFAPARDRFAIALRANPDDIETQSCLAFCSFMAEPLLPNNQRSPTALNAFNTLSLLAKSNPDNIKILLFHGKLLNLLGEDRAALKTFEHILSLNDKHPDAQRELRILRMRRESPPPSSSPSLIDRFRNLFKR